MHTFMAGKMIDKVGTSICRAFLLIGTMRSISCVSGLGIPVLAQTAQWAYNHVRNPRMPIDHFREFNFYSAYKPDSAFFLSTAARLY